MKRTTVKMKGKPCCPQPPVSIQILNGGILAPSSGGGESEFLLKENEEFILIESGDNIELE